MTGTLPYYLAIRAYLLPLEDREGGPEVRSHEYATLHEYHAAYHLRRAIRRDADLTDQERAAQRQAMLSMAGIRFWCDWCHELFPPQYARIPGIGIGPFHPAGGMFNHGLRRVEIGVVPVGRSRFATWMRDAHTGQYL